MKKSNFYNSLKWVFLAFLTDIFVCFDWLDISKKQGVYQVSNRHGGHLVSFQHQSQPRHFETSHYLWLQIQLRES